MRGLHRWTGFDIVENAVFINEIYLDKAVDAPFSAFFAGVAFFMEELS